MTQTRPLAGDVEGARDPAKEAKRDTLDDENVKSETDSRRKDSKERARDSAAAAAASRTGFT